MDQDFISFRKICKRNIQTTRHKFLKYHPSGKLPRAPEMVLTMIHSRGRRRVHLHDDDQGN